MVQVSDLSQFVTWFKYTTASIYCTASIPRNKNGKCKAKIRILIAMCSKNKFVNPSYRKRSVDLRQTEATIKDKKKTDS